MRDELAGLGRTCCLALLAVGLSARGRLDPNSAKAARGMSCRSEGGAPRAAAVAAYLPCPAAALMPVSPSTDSDSCAACGPLLLLLRSKQASTWTWSLFRRGVPCPPHSS